MRDYAALPQGRWKSSCGLEMSDAQLLDILEAPIAEGICPGCGRVVDPRTYLSAPTLTKELSCC